MIDAPCATCSKPTTVCVCDRSPQMAVPLRIVVLQHPDEQDVVLGTVPLLERMVGAQRFVGLSWPHLPVEREGRWAVVWPSQLPRELTTEEQAQRVTLVPLRPASPEEGPLCGVVVLDGSWSQAKALWWRNAWLLKLDRIVVHPSEPSIYGRVRKEPRNSYVSTLEAIADVLDAHGAEPEVRTNLRRAMRTMVQRARQAGLPR